MQGTGETLTAADIIHHKDRNPFNRALDNLEKKDRASHLAEHDYWRGHRCHFDYDIDPDMPF